MDIITAIGIGIVVVYIAIKIDLDNEIKDLFSNNKHRPILNGNSHTLADSLNSIGEDEKDFNEAYSGYHINRGLYSDNAPFKDLSYHNSLKD